MKQPPTYVMQSTFGIAPETWAEAMQEIRQLLIQKATQRAMIPYSELVSLVNAIDFDAFDTRLFAILGQLSIEEDEHDRPLLSVLVVHKHGDMKPGPGFFELASYLGRDTRDVDKTWILETQRVFQYWNR